SINQRDGLELFVHFVNCDESVAGLQQWASARLQLADLLQEHSRSLEPGLWRLTLGDVGTLRGGEIACRDNYLFDAAVNFPRLLLDLHRAPMCVENKKAADGGGGDENGSNDVPARRLLHRRPV